jgi:hypothetical protein
MAYENWKWTNEPGLGRIQSRNVLRYAIPLSLLVVPISLVRHLVRGTAGFILTAVLCTLLVIVVAINMTRTRRRVRS